MLKQAPFAYRKKQFSTHQSIRINSFPDSTLDHIIADWVYAWT